MIISQEMSELGADKSSSNQSDEYCTYRTNRMLKIFLGADSQTVNQSILQIALVYDALTITGPENHVTFIMYLAVCDVKRKVEARVTKKTNDNRKHYHDQGWWQPKRMSSP